MREAAILNVDDQEAPRYLRSRLLRKAGYRVQEAGTGAQTIELLKAKPFDLVLLDINLPDMSGLEVCRSIKASPAWASIPVLHVSASAVAPSDAALGLEGGADGYLTEPVDPGVLLATVRALLRARRAEQERYRSEQRFRRLFESDVIGIAVANSRLVLDANEAFLRLIGWTREELAAGKVNWREATPPELRHLDERALRELSEQGVCTAFEREYICKDGSRVPVYVGAALLDRTPELTWIAFIVDLTERKRLEQQLRNAHKLESIGLLAGGIAHDFNNLLTAIMGNIGLVLQSLPPMEPGRQSLQDALQACHRAADLTSQLLAYAGKGRFLVQPIDLSQVLSGIAGVIRASVPRQIEIEFNLVKDLRLVEADAAQIEQLVLNLIANGVEAIGNQPGALTISTGIEEVWESFVCDFVNLEISPGVYAYLEVRDTGCGMDEAIQPRIFEPFFTTKFLGRGLGLAAVAGIVRTHRGFIRVASTPGQGSTFRLLFPPCGSKPGRQEE
jgi:two-component system, cell cycle sensor histidine kinase and response regulator CckA